MQQDFACFDPVAIGYDHRLKGDQPASVDSSAVGGIQVFDLKLPVPEKQ